MRHITIALSILFASFACRPSWSQDCAPLKPDRSVDTEIKDKTNLDANVLLKSLGSGALANEYGKIQKNQPYQNVDETHKWDSFLYTVCSILAKSHLSANEKIDKLQHLYNLKEQGPPAASSDTSSDSPSKQFILSRKNVNSHVGITMRCLAQDNNDFSNQICGQLSAYQDKILDVTNLLGASGISITVSSDAHQNNLFLLNSSSRTTIFDTHWMGVTRPDVRVELAAGDARTAWNAAQEFVQRLQNLAFNAP